jgi:UDP-N-acetylmuramyl-tripeptide synthetase
MPTLGDIIRNTKHEIYGDPDVNVTGINYDSREVKPGNVFFCLEGEHTNGKYFVNDAVSRGAKVIVSDEKITCPPEVTLLIVEDRLKALAAMSAGFYDHPSKKLSLIGVTGTNGKTTVTYLVESIFRQAGVPVAVIGTVNYRIGDEIITPKTTTPQASDLQYLLDLSLKKGIKTVVMEVSSHALVLGRVAHCEFDMCVFTNLTRDHLDFHKTMDDYFHAKLKLFQILSEISDRKDEKFAIINKDDRYAGCISDSVKVPVITYGLNKKSDITANSMRTNHRGMRFNIHSDIGSIDISTSLIGRYNIYNILAACACAVAKKIDLRCIKKGIEKIGAVPGRLERIDCGQPFTVIVDYAHTDDALCNVLSTIKELNPKRLVTVFGCGGDRDRLKRSLMGEVAADLSDYVILTNDNPRTEEPQKIILDIEVGVRKKGKDNYKVILDRKQAIEDAINMAEKNDVVLIAGKGHESYQIIGDNRIPFDDREIARKYLQKRMKGSH